MQNDVSGNFLDIDSVKIVDNSMRYGMNSNMAYPTNHVNSGFNTGIAPSAPNLSQTVGLTTSCDPMVEGGISGVDGYMFGPNTSYGSSNNQFIHNGTNDTSQNQNSMDYTNSNDPRYNLPNKGIKKKVKVKKKRIRKSPRGRNIGDRLAPVFGRYGIDQFYHEDILSLEDFDIVIIGDDSGSMRASVDNSKKTRWDELKSVMRIVTDLGTALDNDGIDVSFLNRSGKRNVTSFRQIQPLFKRPPHGYTPLAKAVNKVLRRRNGNKKMLLIIATDGEPTTERGKIDKKGFTKALKKRDCENVFVSILACSDDDDEVGYLNKIDRKVKNVDVLDDYRSERKEVIRAQGRDFPYSFGDHVARLLLGPIFPKYDLLDEVSLREGKGGKRKTFGRIKRGCAIM